MKLEKVIGYALTEPHKGSEAVGLETTAQK